MAICISIIFAILLGTALLLPKAIKGHSNINGALLACAFLLIANTQAILSYTSLIENQTYSWTYSLFTHSNHFIISLDIISLFSILMLIIFNALKLEDSHSEN